MKIIENKEIFLYFYILKEKEKPSIRKRKRSLIKKRKRTKSPLITLTIISKSFTLILL